ncbi:hypothetical protein [Flavobacterium sp.]|uniref:hypothetical protein n=1 Tax=Flavobacterium sp. TaxID=239 RepID=UPI002FD925FD
MTATEIKEIINRELAATLDHSNVFGMNLTKYLIEPKKQIFKAADSSNISYELWTVLEDEMGYKVYFDEETNMFGLAMKLNENEQMDIGTHGSFLETLYGM